MDRNTALCKHISKLAKKKPNRLRQFTAHLHSSKAQRYNFCREKKTDNFSVINLLKERLQLNKFSDI